MKNVYLRYCPQIILSGSALLAAQMPPAQLKVRLTAPLTTKLNRAGDLVVAKILQPAEYAGGYLEGEVRDVRAGSPTKKSTIDFQFHSLHLAGKDSRISAGVVQITNSRHQADKDEDGADIEQEKAAGGGGLAGLSHLSSGIMSHIPRIGEKADKAPKQSGPSSALSRISAKGPSLSLAAGSELTVQFISPASK